MIISRTPFRISFVGGGSDFPDYYREFGGAVISATISKYIFLSMHPFFNEDKYFLKYSINEIVYNVDEIKHRIIREIFKDYKIKGVDFNSSADLPGKSGLGSSSAFAVGLTSLCNAFTGKYLSQSNIAEYVCKIEIERLGEPIGKQDQYACAVGGINHISFNADDTVNIEKILLPTMKKKYLESHLLLLYMGQLRDASDILKEQSLRLKKRKNINNLHKIVSLTEDLIKELNIGNIDCLGEILDTGWHYKRELAGCISTPKIDQYYATAIKNGAIGGKLLGAGGGGFFLFYVPENKRNDVIKALPDLKETTFHFDYEGTKIIYYDQ